MAGEAMDFPDTFEEFAEGYGIRDSDEVYTNGSLLIPVFRVRQWLSHLDRERVIRCPDCDARVVEPVCDGR